jgi:hypothetical protein
MKHFDYDQADWIVDMLDYGLSPTEKTTETFWPTGWEKQRVIAAGMLPGEALGQKPHTSLADDITMLTEVSEGQGRSSR